MKKKLMICPFHGLSLFRCKRTCWFSGDKHVSDYKEKCFKCIYERKNTDDKETPKKQTFISLR